MFYPLYKQCVLRKIMGYDLMFFIMQAEFLIIAERLNALVSSYEAVLNGDYSIVPGDPSSSPSTNAISLLNL